MPRLLKLCIYNFENASRNYRELSAAIEAGYDITVLAGNRASSAVHGTVDFVKGFEVHYYNPMHTKSPLPFESKPGSDRTFFEKLIRHFIRSVNILRYNKIANTFRWAKKVKSFSPDTISCHDITALIIGFISTKLMLKHKPKLVYDSHEFEIERNTSIPRTKLQKWYIKCLEGFLMRRCAFSTMVNDSIADEVQRIHRLKTRPLVIKSTPLNWQIDLSICEKRKQEFKQLTRADEHAFFVMYHGLIARNRGVEILIKTVAINPNIIGIIMGYALDEKFMQNIVNLASELDVAHRILFLPAVPIENLWEYVGAADVGIIPMQNTCVSYYYSLNNKFFENIQSLTPVIASNFPELTRWIEHYNVGLTCNPSSEEAINVCIEKMRTDKIFYAELKQNLLVAKHELCWENEKITLIDAYRNIINS